MFILRRITSEGIQVNENLGNDYNYVNQEYNEVEFNRTIKEFEWLNDSEIYGYITYTNGSKMLALYKKSAYFVMCSDGKTFDNITFRR